MRRLVGILLAFLLISSGSVSVIAEDKNIRKIQDYEMIYNCYIDIKNEKMESLTKYLLEHLNLEGYTICFEKCIAASLASDKYWILYSIYKDARKTPYCIWVNYENGEMKYSNKWSKEKLDSLAKDERSYLLCLPQLEEAKMEAYISFDDSKLSYQTLNIKTDLNLRPVFSILNSYEDSSKAFFALGMDVVFDKDIIPGKQEIWSQSFAIAENLTNYVDLENYLSKNIDGFKDYSFELVSTIPAYADHYYINSNKDNSLKMQFYRMEQNSYRVYGMKYNNMETPYKVVITVDKDGKLCYEYNFSTEDLNAFTSNAFIKNMKIPEGEVLKAVEKCTNAAKEYFKENEYEILSKEIEKGIDEEFRFYVDVKIIYKDIKYKNDGKLCVSSRYYVSL